MNTCMYSVDDFVAQLSSTIEDIIDREVNPVFLITGDFNLLCTEFLEENFGFDQLVQTSTHGNNILDKVFTNRPDLFKKNCASEPPQPLLFYSFNELK